MNSAPTTGSVGHRSDGARGFALIELLISLVIGLFLLGALVVGYAGMQQTFSAQSAFSQLQDDQRMASNLLSDVVQEAGYFYNPQTATSANTFPSNSTFATAGQAVAGSSASGSASDVLTVRFVASPAGTSSDFIINCNGASNADTMNPASYVNAFTVNASHELTCSVNGATAIPLVGNVASWSVQYGVDTTGAGTVSQYLAASNMTAALWSSVLAVRITLQFANPLSGQPQQPATIPLIRVIPVMGSI